jgi:hypothetical protein
LNTSPLASEYIGCLKMVAKIIASKKEFGWLAAISKGPLISSIEGLFTTSFLQYSCSAIFAGYFNSLNNKI